MIKKFIKYLIQKLKYRQYLKFYYSSEIGLKSRFEGDNLVQRYVRFNGEMGYGSYIAEDSSINGKIGRFTSIGPKVRCNAGLHPYTYPFATTSPWFYSNNPLKFRRGPRFISESVMDEYAYIDTEKGYAVEIGNDCWIGEGVFLVGGITIGDGAVILAHAVVTKSVPPYAIVAGIPAKIIGYRYSGDIIKKLLELKWWNMDINWIRNNANLMQNIENLISLKETPDGV